MSDNTTEAAAALIRLHAMDLRAEQHKYGAIGEEAAAQRMSDLADHFDRAAEFLRDPPYDAKAAAASHLAGTVYHYLEGIKSIHDLTEALAKYDDVEDEGEGS